VSRLVPFQPALRALDTILGWKDPWMPVERLRMDERRRSWHRCGSGRALVSLVQGCDELYSDEILLGLPERERGRMPCGATVLWARVEGPDQLERARKFRPLPTMAVQEGSSTRRWLLWAVDRWMPYFEVEERNRKIAYRLGATQKHGLPENFWLPAPGSCLRVGRSRPVPIIVRRLESQVFSPDIVTRRLKQPPERDAWKAAAR